MYKEMSRRIEPEGFLSDLNSRLLNPEEAFKKLSVVQQYELILSKSADHPERIIPKADSGGSSELLDALDKSRRSGKPLSVKLGVDATGPNIHIGHAISLLMLRRFQWMGHKVKFVVGDFTGMIGDPTGRSTERDVITTEQVEKNMSTYKEQAGRLIDLNDRKKVEVFYNSEWLSKMTMTDWLPILQHISGSQLIQREDFIKRLQAGGKVSAAEMFYPLFMAFDSVQIKPDIELGGVDQLLNLHWCRELMKIHDQHSEIFILVDLLPGTSGERDDDGKLIKMSKSKNNYIMVTEDPNEMYGKTMSISDDVMWVWFKNLTEISESDLGKLKHMVEEGTVHPMDAKKLLARVVVATFNNYDSKIVESAENAFANKFGKEKVLVPDDLQTVNGEAGDRVIDILSEITGESKATIRKMSSSVESSGIKILEGDKYRGVAASELIGLKLQNGQELIVKVGKRRYFRISAK